MRPGSRAGGTAYGAVPGTRAGGTAMGGRPPATARLQSGLTSSMGRQAAQGIALQHGINITDRPTTMQGMKGMRATTAGPGRMVQDSTYFVGVLRGKVNAITEEISKIQKEIDGHNKDQSQSLNMQRKAEELDAEVRKLEGTLADYNIAMDKLRQGTDPADLTNYIKEFESRNKAFGHEIDRIFLQVKQEEQAFVNVEQQIEDVYRGNQSKINAMEPGKLNHYQELVNMSLQLQEKYQQQANQVDSIADQVSMLQAQRESNTFNQDYKTLEASAIKLHKKMQNLSEELEIMKLQPDEMQARMLAKVRADNSQSQAVDERIRNAKEELRKSEQISAELSADLEERNSGGNSEKDKYEKLYARDNEMTESINKFDGEKKELVQETEETQNRIVKLLSHISEGVESQNNMPSEDRAKEMSEEATFKEKQLESSQATMARLQSEKQQRLSDIEKITNLDEKIKIELNSLSAKMVAMQEEMVAFDDLEEPRRKANETKAYLQDMMESYKKRTRSSKEQVTSLRRKYDALKSQLNENETYKQMESNEGRLRKYAQTIFNLNEFVESKGRETDFEALKENCMAMTAQLNNLVKESIVNQSQNLSDAPISSQFAKY